MQNKLNILIWYSVIYLFSDICYLLNKLNILIWRCFCTLLVKMYSFFSEDESQNTFYTL